jgi:hypothetical protein
MKKAEHKIIAGVVNFMPEIEDEYDNGLWLALIVF